MVTEDERERKRRYQLKNLEKLKTYRKEYQKREKNPSPIQVGGIKNMKANMNNPNENEKPPEHSDYDTNFDIDDNYADTIGTSTSGRNSLTTLLYTQFQL